MADLNVWIVEGNIGSDPKISYVGEKGTPKCFFMLANHRGFNGNTKVNWIPCVIWGNRGEKVAQYLKKGTRVIVTGEGDFSSYKDSNGDWKNFNVLNCRDVSFGGGNGNSNSSNNETTEESSPEASPFAVEEEATPESSTAVDGINLDDLM